jgi:queuine/archaeosine tRNA-ribosyltransferase
MVSLLHLADITEDGVTFQSPVDGSSMLLTPEHSIRVQNQLGADVIMALDDVVSSVHDDGTRFAEATARTTRWIDRCIAAHGKPQSQNLFAIVQARRAALLLCTDLFAHPRRRASTPPHAVAAWHGVQRCQPHAVHLPATTLSLRAHALSALVVIKSPPAQGGLNNELRDRSVRELVERDLPGYAIGGLAGGEDKASFWRVVARCAAALPRSKPRYVMGVGAPKTSHCPLRLHVAVMLRRESLMRSISTSLHFTAQHCHAALTRLSKHAPAAAASARVDKTSEIALFACAGYPVDIVVCSALGADMFDSVFPTRTARFGVALVGASGGAIKLKNRAFQGALHVCQLGGYLRVRVILACRQVPWHASEVELGLVSVHCFVSAALHVRSADWLPALVFADDKRPIEEACDCETCKHYSRAAVHSALCLGLPAGGILVSLHNVAYLQRLTYTMRQAIREHQFTAYVQDFMLQQYPDRQYPKWVVDALAHVDITLL